MYKFEVYPDKSHEYRWRLVAPNGKILADSGEGYNTRAGCKDAINLVKRVAPTASVEDVS